MIFGPFSYNILYRKQIRLLKLLYRTLFVIVSFTINWIQLYSAESFRKLSAYPVTATEKVQTILRSSGKSYSKITFDWTESTRIYYFNNNSSLVFVIILNVRETTQYDYSIQYFYSFWSIR